MNEEIEENEGAAQSFDRDSFLKGLAVGLQLSAWLAWDTNIEGTGET